MEFREAIGVPIRVWEDHMMNTSFVDVLTDNELYSVKLPSSVDQYKLGHLINPEYLLEFELVKTRKNWVVKNITIVQKIANPKTYEEHILYAQMIKTITKLSHTDQQTEALGVLILFLKQPLDRISLARFEGAIMDSEGFLETQENSALAANIQRGKQSNNLEM